MKKIIILILGILLLIAFTSCTFFKSNEQQKNNTLINNPPTVKISLPLNNSSFESENFIIFTGEAIDVEDGDISDNIVWTSSINGQIGIGKSVTISNLSVGTHEITATVTDSGKLSNSEIVKEI